MDLEAFLAVSEEVRSDENRLVVVIGPFAVQQDNNYSYWQGFKVFVGDVTIVAPLVRLANNGEGGFVNIKLWHRHDQKYLYRGDPAQGLIIHPEAIIQLTCEHLSSQYHVGHVERKSNAVNRQQVEARESNILVADTAEARRRIAFEDAAANLRKKN